MTPYEIASGSLFLTKEAGLQKILQSVSNATGADPTRLQDALIGLGAGGLAGGGIGALAGGGKGALLGSLLGGGGGAAGGYVGSPYVREFLEKLLGPVEGRGADPGIIRAEPPSEKSTDIPSVGEYSPEPQLREGDAHSLQGLNVEGPDPELLAGMATGLPSLKDPKEAPLAQLGPDFGPSLDVSSPLPKSEVASRKDDRLDWRNKLRDEYPQGSIGDLLNETDATLLQKMDPLREKVDRGVQDLQTGFDNRLNDFGELVDTVQSGVGQAKQNFGDTVDRVQSQGIMNAPVNPLDWLLQSPQLQGGSN